MLLFQKPGLLIPRDPIDDDCFPDPDPPNPSTASRRPADIWVPRGPSGGQEAWDFSITNACLMGLALADSTAIPGVFASVESRRNTTQYGHSVHPVRLHILLSGPGGLSDAFRSVLEWIPSETNRSGPTNGSDASFKIAQCISCTLLQGKRARDLEEGTKPDWFSLAVAGSVSLGRIGACTSCPGPSTLVGVVLAPRSFSLGCAHSCVIALLDQVSTRLALGMVFCVHGPPRMCFVVTPVYWRMSLLRSLHHCE